MIQNGGEAEFGIMSGEIESVDGTYIAGCDATAGEIERRGRWWGDKGDGEMLRDE